MGAHRSQLARLSVPDLFDGSAFGRTGRPSPRREFLGLVGVAFVLGSAAAYLVTNEWLGGFATRIDLSPVVFLDVGVGALVLAVAAVTWQSVSVVRVDPARVLEQE